LKRKVEFKRDTILGLLDYCKDIFPNEGILLLRGKVSSERIIVYQLIIPPLATHGAHFSGFPYHMLPFDSTIVGVAHSHPSGILEPSLQDLHHVFGRILAICGPPFIDERNVAVFDPEGQRVDFEVS
jgi:proteasome lid subunit RPN8/RPN11